ncbi:MAG: zinc-ribbon domain-containing protein [Myxococcota bacterium]|nr:zinc-ribbon domain-containing protein [Myxococcota bacterium]
MKLRCMQCGVDFEFTADEQAFFADRGLTSAPKRCRTCRKAHKKQKQLKGHGGAGIYRSPAFGNSAPIAQQNRGPKGAASAKSRAMDYRAPAFRELDTRTVDEEYRSPAFRNIDRVNPEDEYRSPGFREHANLDATAEYRSPGFQDLREQRGNERPMFQITCSDCQQVAMVPFLPEEKEGPHFCQECYAKERKRLAEERAKAEAAQEAAPPLSLEPKD